MSLVNLPSELFSSITQFLENKSSCNFIVVCKTFFNHGSKYGYLNSLTVNRDTDILWFYKIFCKHNQSVKSIILDGIDNPIIWMPSFVENVCFKNCNENCSDRSYIIKTGKTGKKTNSFKYIDHNRYKMSKKHTIQINWENFRNLKNIELYVYNVDFTGIDVLTNLEYLKVNTLVDIREVIGLNSLQKIKNNIKLVSSFGCGLYNSFIQQFSNKFIDSF